MSQEEKNKQTNDQPKPKMSLQEAMKNKLAAKKKEQSGGQADNGLVKSTKKMTNQLTKKPNNQRRRTGV
ncbi:hypothetical protein CEF21_04385 [Bacillus sp. FJAT-42376]|uniref:hypothetical protein n=1 Tax=Bacillus sp. FJAT-42376 TaxID=2014076 RepID=UPI000F5088F3|nr:hypothetical protein [Bacillus sp. FJAT-42376]AZB41597.1 hypothetical protein CEF21_04385 [Bacillus sp. FJAT-42376]